MRKSSSKDPDLYAIAGQQQPRISWPGTVSLALHRGPQRLQFCFFFKLCQSLLELEDQRRANATADALWGRQQRALRLPRVGGVTGPQSQTRGGYERAVVAEGSRRGRGSASRLTEGGAA